MKIGLGLVTYKRPDYFQQSVEAAIKAKPDYLVIYNDGSDKKTYEKIYKEIEDQAKIIHQEENKGVAKAKNTLLKDLLAVGCDELFILEDDIIIKKPEVFQRYIEAGKQRGLEHLNFAHHGPANVNRLLSSDGVIDYYPDCVGAFSYYTANCIKEAGLLNENFNNAWEHVEHTKRVGDLGLSSPFGAFADVAGSKELLEEIPGSIEGSSIRPTKEWKERMVKGLEYWRNIDPTCPVELRNI